MFGDRPVWVDAAQIRIMDLI
jgi:hypothetical protein